MHNFIIYMYRGKEANTYWRQCNICDRLQQKKMQREAKLSRKELHLLSYLSNFL